MPRNDRQKAPLPGLKSDVLDPFRPPEGEDPQQQFEIAGNEAFHPTEAEQVYIKSVLLMAENQFSGFKVMPEAQNVGERFPGIDPVGNYGPIDMKFAQREAILRGMLESSPPKVQAYVNGFLDKCKDPQTPFGRMKESMKKTARNHRLASRASKLCADVAGRKLMYQKALDLEVDQSVVQYDKLMQGLEYAAGVRTGPVPREITDFYRDTLETELDLGMGTAARTRDQVPAQIHMNFQNLENRILQGTFANPDNWGRPPEEVARIAEAYDNAYDAAIPSYVTATADRVIDPMFREMEKTAPANAQGLDIEFSRGDLISIDGKTVRETMQEIFQKSGRSGSFADFYKQNVKQAANELVAAGLMAGKRVEAFVPNKYGQIPKEPSQITKTGYEPSPLKPEKFNAWQRFFAKRGFYKAKVARQAEYERVMAARERMKASAQASAQARNQERAGMLKDAVKLNASMLTLEYKELFFGELMRGLKVSIETATPEGETKVQDVDLRTETTTPDGKTEVKYNWHAMCTYMQQLNPENNGAYTQFDRSEPVDACVMGLLAQGHKFEDILNPEKLQAERQAMARQFMEHGKTNDQEWLGRIYYQGFKATLQQLKEMTQGVDLSDEVQMVRVIPKVEALTHSAFSANQTLHADGCRLGYYKAAMEDAGGDLARGNQLAASFDRQINSINLFSQMFLYGIQGQVKLIDPQIKIMDLEGTEKALSFCAMGSAAMKIMQPGTSIVDWSPDFITSTITRDTMSMQMGPVYDALVEAGPEQMALVAQSAASGKLMGEQIRTSAAMSRNAMEEPLFQLARREDGAIIGQNVRVQINYSHPDVSLEVDKELAEPVKQEPQVQAKQKRAPHKQAPHKQPLQTGGLRL